MILLIDNYDSFTYNLYQYMGIFEKDIKVVRNDKVTIEEIEQLNFYQKKPILGICLGHQSIGAAFGAEIVHAKELMHGKQSLITQDGRGIFEGIPSPVHVARYHSLAVDEKTLPDVFEILARTEDGEIMAMQHKEYPLIGIQFHPESIYTDHGKKMIENFLKL